MRAQDPAIPECGRLSGLGWQAGWELLEPHPGPPGQTCQALAALG